MPVPAGAIAHVDFLAVTAFVADTGSVGIERLVGSDPALINYATEYSPAGLTLYGYDYAQTGNWKPPAFINELKAAFLAGKSIVIKFQSGPDPGGWNEEDFETTSNVETPGGTRRFAVQSEYGEVSARTSAAPALFFGDVWNYSAVAGGAVNAVGFTLVSSSYYDLAANNEVSGRQAITDADTPPGYPFTAFGLDAYGPIVSITAFERLTTAELKAQTEPVIGSPPQTFFVNYRSTASQAGL